MKPSSSIRYLKQDKTAYFNPGEIQGSFFVFISPILGYQLGLPFPKVKSSFQKIIS